MTQIWLVISPCRVVEAVFAWKFVKGKVLPLEVGIAARKEVDYAELHCITTMCPIGFLLISDNNDTRGNG